MKPSIIKILTALFLLASIPGCKKNYIINDEQALYFQFDYVNHAWGYQHSGFIIDNEGSVLTYNNPENWNFPDKDLILSEKDVEENLSKCTPGPVAVTNDELKKYTGYIRHIASSKVTALKNIGADAGTAQFICWQYSPHIGEYKGYLIKMEGDYTCENLNFYSKRVVSWMKDIHGNLDQF